MAPLPREPFDSVDAGWSSPVARRAHNPKVVSSNLASATFKPVFSKAGFFCLWLTPNHGVMMAIHEWLPGDWMLTVDPPEIVEDVP